MTNGPSPVGAALAGLAAIKEILRQSTLSALQQHSKTNDIIISETSEAGPVHAHWMSVILLAGSSVRVTMKAFYRTVETKKLAAGSLRRDVKDIPDRLVTDYMREFSNIAAGGAKRILGTLNIPMGLSLPLVTRGFDEAFATVKTDGSESSDLWVLKNNENSLLICSSLVTVQDWGVLNGLSWKQTETEDDSGDMEFL